MNTENIWFVSPDAFRYFVKQVCTCEGSKPVSRFVQMTGIYCNVKTRDAGVEYEEHVFICDKCDTPYEVGVAVDIKKIAHVTGVRDEQT